MMQFLVVPPAAGKNAWPLGLHRAPIPEDEPLPGDEPEPDDDPVPHPDPVIREPDQPPLAPMSASGRRGQ